MHLSYNDIELELLSLDRVERTNVYSPDRADLLYVRWAISATCVFAGIPSGHAIPVPTASVVLSDPTRRDLATAPQPGLSSTTPAVRPKPPLDVMEPVIQVDNTQTHRQGLRAIMSDAELRVRLLLPRKQLAIYAYDERGERQFWFVSPAIGLLCDATNGPHPLSCDVVDSTGEGQMMGVHYQVETDVPAVPTGYDQLILSHRWEMRHDHDADNYLTRTIQGEVVFDGGKMQTLDAVLPGGMKADWFRSQLFHPVPLGYRRTLGPIRLSPDGLVLQYTIIDTDTSVVFDAGDSGATQMSIVEHLRYSIPWNLTGLPKPANG